MSKEPHILDTADVADLIARSLEEDIQTGDVTSESLIATDATSSGTILARQSCVVSGVTIARDVFKAVDPALEVTILKDDGQSAVVDDAILQISGSVRSILTAERTALNFMQRMTGMASMTRQFVDAINNPDVLVLDTRKTTPSLRVLEKYAVLCGGGTNHRMGLYDRVLIKDNHRKIWATGEKRGLAEAVSVARDKHPDLVIEIEVESEAELRDALAASPDWVLLDNMGPEALRKCVEINAGRSKLEASGGITLATVEAVAATGIDAISLGCLTHSAPAADLSLELKD